MDGWMDGWIDGWMDGWMIAMHGFPYEGSTIILGNHHWVSEMKMSSTIINIEYKAYIFLHCSIMMFLYIPQ